jgi:hypothetical protein
MDENPSDRQTDTLVELVEIYISPKEEKVLLRFFSHCNCTHTQLLLLPRPNSGADRGRGRSLSSISPFFRRTPTPHSSSAPEKKLAFSRLSIPTHPSQKVFHFSILCPNVSVCGGSDFTFCILLSVGVCLTLGLSPCDQVKETTKYTKKASSTFFFLVVGVCVDTRYFFVDFFPTFLASEAIPRKS